ncbi:MAG TPA: DUF533 domain-containing protein [Planctomycetota bacterium]|nr:DUF533 domain-containing protein [Planctomycetota bacterium]
MPNHSQANPNFSREELLLFCRAVANIIAADRKVSTEERLHLSELIQETGLSMRDPDVQAVIDKELAHPAPIEEVVRAMKNPVLRKNLYRTLIEVALSDGLAPEEDKKLADLAKTFELNQQAARELIQWTLESVALDKREEEILQRL